MRFKRVYIEITNKCNLSCSFCPKLKRAPREMTSDEFAPVASQVRKFTDYIFLHVKGEPLSHSEFDKILTICDEEELKVNITTNGTLLKKSINTLQSHNCIRQVNISLHSMCCAVISLNICIIIITIINCYTCCIAIVGYSRNCCTISPFPVGIT